MNTRTLYEVLVFMQSFVSAPLLCVSSLFGITKRFPLLVPLAFTDLVFRVFWRAGMPHVLSLPVLDVMLNVSFFLEEWRGHVFIGRLGGHRWRPTLLPSCMSKKCQYCILTYWKCQCPAPEDWLFSGFCWTFLMLGLLHAGSWVRVHGHTLPFPKTQESGQRQRGCRKGGAEEHQGQKQQPQKGLVRKERARVESWHHPIIQDSEPHWHQVLISSLFVSTWLLDGKKCRFDDLKKWRWCWWKTHCLPVATAPCHQDTF